MLALPSVFIGIAIELTMIMGEPPIEVLKGELMWLLDLLGQLTPKWHLQLLLCKPDINNEHELCFVQMYGAGLFEIGVHIDERCGKQHWSDTPFERVA